MTSNDTIFGKIIRGEIPSKKVYEDDDVLAFHDIHPVADVHFLLIPKKYIPTLADTTADDIAILGKMLHLAPILARAAINTGRMGRQDVYHLHIHVFGNKPGGEPLKVMLGK